MRLIIGCTLAMLFSTNCAYAQAYIPDDAPRNEAPSSDLAEFDYGTLVRAEIGLEDAETSEVRLAANAAIAAAGEAELALQARTKSPLHVGERERMEAIVSAVTGLVPAEADQSAPRGSALPRKIERIDILPSVEAPDAPEFLREGHESAAGAEGDFNSVFEDFTREGSLAGL